MIHQTGRMTTNGGDALAAAAALEAMGPSLQRLRAAPSDMPEVLACADLVAAPAGAISIAGLLPGDCLAF